MQGRRGSCLLKSDKRLLHLHFWLILIIFWWPKKVPWNILKDDSMLQIVILFLHVFIYFYLKLELKLEKKSNLIKELKHSGVS